MTITIHSSFTADGGQLAYISVDDAVLFEIREEPYGVESRIWDGRWQPLRVMPGSFEQVVTALARIAGQPLPTGKAA